jgi:hypothetical protein
LILIYFYSTKIQLKYNKDPLHAFFSTICELPPILRNSNKNIITHSLWTGSSPDFNNFLSRHNNQLDNLLKNGLLIDKLNMILQITCHVFIADAPERASILNMNKFNGKYGCFMCIQQGENLISNE